MITTTLRNQVTNKDVKKIKLSRFDFLLHFLCRLITHAKQLLQDKEESLCVRVLQTIKGMMARDIDFGDKVRAGSVILCSMNVVRERRV